jgi:hypothetical protein
MNEKVLGAKPQVNAVLVDVARCGAPGPLDLRTATFLAKLSEIGISL